MTITDAYRRGLITVRDRVESVSLAAWDAMPRYDEDLVPEFLDRTVPLILAGQAAAVTLTDAYMGRAVGRDPLGLDPERFIGAAARNGTPPEQVYKRPFQHMWRELGAGKAWQLAQQEARFRLSQTALTDVMLSARNASNEITATDPRIVGYRRVTSGNPCRFCEEISTRRYNKAELLPVHPHCSCTVEPLTDPSMAGKVVIDQDKYQRINAEKADGRPAAEISTHNELGPVVHDAAHAFA